MFFPGDFLGKMESIEQNTALTFMGEQKIAARIDYQTCNRCGFRLKRIETTMIGNQNLTMARCPICEQAENNFPNETNAAILSEDRLCYFDIWLGTHGLDRNTLENHYHLRVEDFFDI